MYISIADQTAVFLRSILFGAAVGAYYDFLRAIRREKRLRGLPTALLDGAFWLAAIAAFALFVLIVADGDWRSYVLVGLGGGLVLYFLTLSPTVLALLGAVLSALLSAAGWLVRTVLLPVRLARRASQRAQKIIHKFRGKNLKKKLPFLRR
ncbi:hypothetical protein D7X33_03670 [Butyricicoccus sp. 1XD8-22]|nr:hypothetical protein D7X33_03670 [Butyricicoccus sp. 1XD8-22]